MHAIEVKIRRPRGRTVVRKTIAVTGGAGFLGSHLCEHLLALGHHVVCIDNFDTGRHANIVHLFGAGEFDLVEHDMVLPLPAQLPRFEQIYNLACPASPRHYQRDPVHTLQTCAMGAMHVMQRAGHDGARVLHASTSEVYGDPDVHPQSEAYFGNVNPVGPRSCYDEGKRFAETLCTDFARQAEVPLRIARIFNTYGPRMRADDGRVVSNFILQALKGEDITLYGDGSQTRSFCYVDDLIDGLVRLMNSDANFSGPVNLGNPAQITVLQLAELVIERTGSHSPIVRGPLPVDAPRRRQPDIAKARAHLGWSASTDLAEGLDRTIDYFATQLACPVPQVDTSFMLERAAPSEDAALQG
ncbi:MAG: NAD-dependent dehydratase [Devosia sp.]|nr:NAD-dependent dehydratase [Devosia sp.]